LEAEVTIDLDDSQEVEKKKKRLDIARQKQQERIEQLKSSICDSYTQFIFFNLSVSVAYIGIVKEQSVDGIRLVIATFCITHILVQLLLVGIQNK